MSTQASSSLGRVEKKEKEMEMGMEKDKIIKMKKIKKTERDIEK